MKKLVIGLLAFLTITTCAACEDNRNYENYTPQEGQVFVCVESYTDPYLGDVKILVDKETRIMYMHYWEHNNHDYGVSGITVLYDSKGMPKKYVGVLKDE